MPLMLDARVPVVFAFRRDAQADDAVLAGVSDRLSPQDLDGARSHNLDGARSHDAGCACCVARNPAAEALSRLFAQRARGEVAFFRRVLVDDPAAEAAVRAALRSDPVASARFRLAEAGPV